MKPYKNKPRQVPTCIAEIFVTSHPRKDGSLREDMTRISFQVPDSNRRSVTGVHSVSSREASSMRIKDRSRSKCASKPSTCCAPTRRSKPPHCEKCVYSACTQLRSPHVYSEAPAYTPEKDNYAKSNQSSVNQEIVLSRAPSSNTGQERQSILSRDSSVRYKNMKKISYAPISVEPNKETLTPELATK